MQTHTSRNNFQEVAYNPLTPLLFLKNLKILNKFKNFSLSLNGNSALPGMENPLLGPFQNLFSRASEWSLRVKKRMQCKHK